MRIKVTLLQDLSSDGREARVLIISPSYRQVRRYPLFSSPDNQIGETQEQDQDSKQTSPPPTTPQPEREEEEEVSAYFEEQDSIEDILEEIEEIENTILVEDLASIVQLRTVNTFGMGNNEKVVDEDEHENGASEDGNIELSFDLRLS